MAPRVALLLIAITLGLGCRLSDDTWDLPTAAFARVRGVVRPDGAPVAGAFVDLACGGEAFSAFYTGPTRASMDGTFELDAGAAQGFAPPPGSSEALIGCRLSARTSAFQRVADSVVAIRFARERATAPLTTVDLTARAF